jgi:hypothetical protein
VNAAEKPTAPYTLRVLCNDENAAHLFEAWLNNEGVDTNGTDGIDVLVPWGGDARFAMEVAEAALREGFGPDDLRPVLRQIECLAVQGA